jgi:hypothetical protein
MHRTAILVGMALLLLGAPRAGAMNFKRLAPHDPKVVIAASGEIVPGDDRKLHDFVAALPNDVTVVGIILDSPGGNLLEGVRLAATVQNSHIQTGAVKMCASACFLIFAAGTEKFVFGNQTRVGVHSASEATGETELSQAITTRMARMARGLHVPPEIIGRMVSTPPSDMAWLTHDELLSIPNTKFVPLETETASNGGYQPGSPLRPGAAAAAVASAPTPQPLPANSQTFLPDPAQNRAFLAGKQARADWENWIAGLSGDSRDGAQWWAAHDSTTGNDDLSCDHQAGMTPAWRDGCQQARLKLAPLDRLRHAELAFELGWNNL